MRKTSVIESELSEKEPYSSCYIHYGKSELQQYIQPAYTQTLVAFDRICRENNIFYTITAGTLLGAVRDGKFIPWDDDIDILVRSEDYWKIKDAIKNSKMENEYDFLTPFDVDEITVDGKFVSKALTFGSILKNPNIEYPIYLDVLAIENVPDSKINMYIRAFFSKIMMISYNSMRCTKRYDELLNIMAKKSWELKFNLLIRKIIAIPAIIFGKNRILRLMYTINYCKNKNSKYVTVPFGVKQYKEEMCPREVFDRTVDIEFEKHIVQAPIGYEYYLTNRYGDWRSLPPKSEQGIKCFKRRKNWKESLQ